MRWRFWPMRRHTKPIPQVGARALAEARSKLYVERAKLARDKARSAAIDRAGDQNHFSEAMLDLFRGVINEQGRKT